jgi:hypothetical protein
VSPAPVRSPHPLVRAASRVRRRVRATITIAAALLAAELALSAAVGLRSAHAQTDDGAGGSGGGEPTASPTPSPPEGAHEAPPVEPAPPAPEDQPVRTGYATDLPEAGPTGGASAPGAPETPLGRDDAGGDNSDPDRGSVPAGGAPSPIPGATGAPSPQPVAPAPGGGGGTDPTPGGEPAGAVPPGTVARSHTVEAGEHLWSIAASEIAAAQRRPVADVVAADVAPYWVRLCMTNRARLRSGDPNLVYPGEVVELPPR